MLLSERLKDIRRPSFQYLSVLSQWLEDRNGRLFVPD